MPELPEVETVKRQLEAVLIGATIDSVMLRRKNLRIAFPKDFSKTLSGKRIKHIERRAKYLLFYFTNSDDVLIAHLGMTGRFSVEKKMPARFAAHDHVVIKLKDGRIIIYNDARRFGLMTLAKANKLDKHALFKDLGPEPLSKDFSEVYLRAALAKRKGPIKPALMDQRLVVGVGNIYASESLFLTKTNPKLAAHKAVKQAPELIFAIRKVLNDAIRSGGSSLRDFVHVSGEAGYFQHEFKVYGRSGKPCLTCNIPLRSIQQAGRTTFFCPSCQK